jgi:hypothetical protein
MGVNVHRVFLGSKDTEGYLAALTLDDEVENHLRSARDKIRAALRAGLRNWSMVVAKRELFEAALADLEPPRLQPKFRMQGSFSYRTCNSPAQVPPQEVDLDDGVFLPVSFLSQNGSTHPAVVSDGFFAAVERILEPLCNQEGWTLHKYKSSCVRVDLMTGAHVDLALYAISDPAFTSLVETASAEAALAGHNRQLAKRQIEEATELTEQLYRGLAEDQIMLAHRKDGWKKSDPRRLEDWFRAAVETHGEQLRRVCRYLKGWRDQQWRSCCLSSITLMAAAVATYERVNSASADRDDKALLMIAQRLPEILLAKIENPVVQGMFLDEDWPDQDRASFVDEANKLLDLLQEAVETTNDPKVALANLTVAFGDRIPIDTDLVQNDGPVTSKRIVAAPQVLSLGLVKELGGAQTVRAAVKKDGDGRYA